MKKTTILFFALLAILLSPNISFSQIVPCVDPLGCPDLIVDESRMATKLTTNNFKSSDCAVQEGATVPGKRKLLRFTFNTPNVGVGDLVIGGPAQHPEWFEYSACHRHYHFAEYGDYRLWNAAAYPAWEQLRQDNPDVLPKDLLDQYPEFQSDFVAGYKEGFCIIDLVDASHLLDDPNTAQPRNYLNCSTNQGLSVGWADEYIWSLDGQWIDVTDVPKGDYVLEAEVNAERFFEEMDYTNNSGAKFIRLR